MTTPAPETPCLCGAPMAFGLCADNCGLGRLWPTIIVTESAHDGTGAIVSRVPFATFDALVRDGALDDEAFEAIANLLRTGQPQEIRGHALFTYALAKET